MLANSKGRLLRGALAAVLACGLMMPSGALAAEGRDSETPPHATLGQPDESAEAAEGAPVTDFDAAPADTPAAIEEGSSDGNASGNADKTATDPQEEGASDGHGGETAKPSHTARITREVFAAAQKATAKAATANADAKAASSSARSSERSNFGITVAGGTPGVDFEFVEESYTRRARTGGNTLTDTLHKLVIKGSAKLTLSTDDFPTTAQDVTIWVNPGIQANIVFGNVNITSPIPCQIERNRNADGETIEPKTRLHITLAEGSDNTLTATNGRWAPAIHCGEGTELVIDDSVPNITTTGEPIEMDPANYPGKIPAGITFVGNDGKTRTAGTEPGDDRLSLLDNANRDDNGELTTGKLTVTGALHVSGIGSVQYENGGDMTFNGGIITATASGKGDGTNGYGAAIGGGGGGNGGTLTFNGGVIETWTSYHGASIGGGAWAHSTQNAEATSYQFNDTLDNGIPTTSQGAPNTVPAASKTCAGDIYINGGVLKPHGDMHGNAIGQGCCSWNEGHEIVIAGGTVLPDTSRAQAKGGNPLVDCVSMGIGAQGGAVSVIGGSVRIGYVESTKSQEGFQAFINGNHSYDSAFGIWPVDTTRDDNPAVSMIAIDLSAEVIKKDESGKPITDGNNAIIDWELSVAGEPYEYGAPTQFTDGKLYLWLPPSATKNQVSVTLSYLDENNKVQKVNPLFRNPGEGDILKRYIDFELPSTYTDKLTKYYDGEPFAAYDLDNPDNWITTEEEPPKKLTDKNALTFKYQRFDKRPAFEGDESPKSLGPEVSSGKDMPSNVGTMKFTMVSTQYSASTDPALAGFKESYWGHRAFGWCDIMPIDSKVSLINAEWVTDKRPGNEHHNSDLELSLNARIDRGDTQPDGAPTKATCKAPEGFIQLYMDGKKVGDPIEIIFPAPPTADTQAADDSADEEQPAPNALRVDNGQGGSYTDFTYTFKPSDADFLVPDATTDGKHIVSVQYLPPDAEEVADLESEAPANYFKSVNPAQNPDAAPKAEVAIDPIDPKPTVTMPPNPDADPDKPKPSVNTDYDHPSADKPSADPSKPGDKTYTGEMTLIYEKPAPGAEESPGAMDVKIATPSSGPITVTAADGTVLEAKIITDEDGNPVRDENGRITVRVNPTSVGKTELTIKQEPNGAYTGTTFVYDVTVKPDPKIAPEPSLTKRAENLTHPAGPTQPGDRIRYTVEAGNSATGSVWTQVVVSDPLPSCLELDEGTLRLANERDGSAEAALEKAASVAASDVGKFSLAERDGKQVLTVPVGSVYGGATARVTFECTVKGDIDFATATAADLDLANIASASGKRLNPDDPDGDDVDLDPQPNPEPGRGPEPTTPPVTPPGGGKVVPLDPGDSNLAFSKAVENLTRPTEKVTKIGDKLRYTVLLENKGPANSVLWNAVVSDPLPQGMEPVAGSIKMVLSGETERAVDDSAYDKASHTLAVACGDLWGGTSAQLTFECTVGADAVGADNGNVALYFAKKPSEDPGHDPTDPGKEPGTPATPPAGEQPKGQTPAATPPTLLPDDPAAGDVKVSKTAENLTSKDGKTRVGDEVRYTIVLRNDGDGTAWMDTVIRDDVPRGLEPVSGSIEMTLSDGTTIDVSDDAYNDQTRRLSVSAGRLYGGRQVTLAFTALVTEDAVGSDVGNVAVALGKLPSKWDPEGTHPEAGQPFDPPAGWEAWERESERVSSEPAYPPGANVDGGVLPRTEGDGNGGKDGKDKTIAGKRLAQTGDDMARAATALGALALASAAALLLARRSRRAR